MDRKSTRLNSSHALHDALPIWEQETVIRKGLYDRSRELAQSILE